MKLVLPAVAALALAAPILASKLVANRPYVQSGPDGAVYARCVPAADAGSAGKTMVYLVKSGGDEVADTYAWYAPEGVTLGWSPIAGKVAVMSRMGGSELGFHLGGKGLAAYSADDLAKLGIAVGPVRGPAGAVQRADVRAVGCEQVPGTNEYDFVIESQGRQFRFDILTGKLCPEKVGGRGGRAIR